MGDENEPDYAKLIGADLERREQHDAERARYRAEMTIELQAQGPACISGSSLVRIISDVAEQICDWGFDRAGYGNNLGYLRVGVNPEVSYLIEYDSKAGTVTLLNGDGYVFDLSDEESKRTHLEVKGVVEGAIMQHIPRQHAPQRSTSLLSILKRLLKRK